MPQIKRSDNYNSVTSLETHQCSATRKACGYSLIVSFVKPYLNLVAIPFNIPSAFAVTISLELINVFHPLSKSIAIKMDLSLLHS